jgi:hypothetical protein
MVLVNVRSVLFCVKNRWNSSRFRVCYYYEKILFFGGFLTVNIFLVIICHLFMWDLSLWLSYMASSNLSKNDSAVWKKNLLLLLCWRFSWFFMYRGLTPLPSWYFLYWWFLPDSACFYISNKLKFFQIRSLCIQDIIVLFQLFLRLRFRWAAQ